MYLQKHPRQLLRKGIRSILVCVYGIPQIPPEIIDVVVSDTAGFCADNTPWSIVELKYTQQYCLFDDNDNQIGNCKTQCAPLEPVLTYLWANSTPPLPLYTYCNQSSAVYPAYAPDCAKCLKNQTGTVVLGNCKSGPLTSSDLTRPADPIAVMDTMSDACEDKPFVSDGNLVKIPDNLFATSTSSATDRSAPTATGLFTPIYS